MQVRRRVKGWVEEMTSAVAPNTGKSVRAAARPQLAAIRPIVDYISAVPRTRYYGSKRKLLPWIYRHLSGLEFDTVLDAFGGTASVSILFRAMRKSVTYHDGLKFNEDVGRTLLASEMALPREEVDAFLVGVQPFYGVISKNFRGIFYLDEENRWLDGFMRKLAMDSLSPSQRSLLRYLVYQACLKKRPFNVFHRANLSLRTTTNVERSFGNWSTWERSFQHHISQAYGELAAMPAPVNPRVEVLTAGNIDRLQPGYDMVYLDPPYVSRKGRYNIDDYWKRYHFLEGLARYKRWGDLIDKESKIRHFEPPRWISQWSRVATFEERLFDLIDRHRSSTVVLSYVTGAFPSERRLKAFFESRFKDVSVHSAEHSHALCAARKRELLFVGRAR